MGWLFLSGLQPDRRAFWIMAQYPGLTSTRTHSMVYISIILEISCFLEGTQLSWPHGYTRCRRPVGGIRARDSTRRISRPGKSRRWRFARVQYYATARNSSVNIVPPYFSLDESRLDKASQTRASIALLCPVSRADKINEFSHERMLYKSLVGQALNQENISQG